MFAHYRKLINKHGFSSKAILWNHTYSIHAELEKIAKQESRTQVIATNGWPDPDFHRILTRIVKMRRELSVPLGAEFNTCLVGQCFAWHERVLFMFNDLTSHILGGHFAVLYIHI